MPGFNIPSKAGGGGTGPSNKVEFHRQHRWFIESLGIPPIGGSRPGSGAQGVAAKALFAQSLQLPSLEFEQEEIKSPSLVYKVAKRAKWKNCVVKFYDVYGLYKKLEEWQKKIWSPENGIQSAIDYKGEPIFVLVDGKGQPKQRYLLKGAYPLNIDHGELSYTSSEVKILTVTYAYDYATIEFMDDQQDDSNAPNGGTGTRARSPSAPANQGINDPNTPFAGSSLG